MTTTANIVAIDLGSKNIKAAHLTCVNNVTKSESLILDDGLRSIEYYSTIIIYIYRPIMAWKNDCERVFGSLARNSVYLFLYSFYSCQDV